MFYTYYLPGHVTWEDLPGVNTKIYLRYIFWPDKIAWEIYLRIYRTLRDKITWEDLPGINTNIYLTYEFLPVNFTWDNICHRSIPQVNCGLNIYLRTMSERIYLSIWEFLPDNFTWEIYPGNTSR